MVGLAREQHPQHGGAEPLLSLPQGAGTLGGQGQQRDRGVHGIALGGAQRRARADREHAAGGTAPGAQRLQLHPVGDGRVLGRFRARGPGLAAPADHDAGGAGAGAQPLDVGGEPGGAAGSPVGGDGDHGAGDVVERGPAVDMGGEPGEQRGGPLGADGGARQLALRLEPGGHGPVLVGGYRRGDGLADRDEGGGAGHADQRQPLLLGRRGERGRHLGVLDAEREAEPDHARAHQPPHIAAHLLRVLGLDLHRGDQEQLAALHIGHGVSELADMCPAHRRLQPVLAREHGQLETGVADE